LSKLHSSPDSKLFCSWLPVVWTDWWRARALCLDSPSNSRETWRWGRHRLSHRWTCGSTCPCTQSHRLAVHTHMATM